jgi:hypothetical protein
MGIVARKVDQTLRTMKNKLLINKIANGTVSENDLPVKLSMFQKQNGGFVNKQTGARLNTDEFFKVSKRGLVFLSMEGLNDDEIETFTNRA